jgi:hypothetical protein
MYSLMSGDRLVVSYMMLAAAEKIADRIVDRTEVLGKFSRRLQVGSTEPVHPPKELTEACREERT